MIIEFTRNDDFTLMLREKKYYVSDYFVRGTTIPLGYSFCMQHVHCVYHVKDNLFVLIQFYPVNPQGNVVGTLRDLYKLHEMVGCIASIKVAKVIINAYPKTEEQRIRQKVLLRFAEKLGARFEIAGPVNFAIFNWD